MFNQYVGCELAKCSFLSEEQKYQKLLVKLNLFLLKIRIKVIVKKEICIK